MKNNIFNIGLASGFSALAGILVGTHYASPLGIFFGSILGCITTLLTGLFFYKPQEVRQTVIQAWEAMLIKVNERKEKMKILRNQRMYNARKLAIWYSFRGCVINLCAACILITSWLLPVALLISHGILGSLEFCVWVNALIVLVGIMRMIETLCTIATHPQDYKCNYHNHWHRKTMCSSLGRKAYWRKRKTYREILMCNPFSVLHAIITTILTNRQLIVVCSKVFILEILKGLNCHARITIALSGMTFCIVGLLLDYSSVNPLFGPVVGFVGGTCTAIIEQLFYQWFKIHIDTTLARLQLTKSSLSKPSVSQTGSF